MGIAASGGASAAVGGLSRGGRIALCILIGLRPNTVVLDRALGRPALEEVGPARGTEWDPGSFKNVMKFHGFGGGLRRLDAGPHKNSPLEAGPSLLLRSTEAAGGRFTEDG